MRPAVVFTTNLIVGAAILAFVLNAYGARAFEIVRTSPSAPLLAAFLAVAATNIVCLSWRWRSILVGLCSPPSLATLTLQRSAAHSLAVIVPSGKLGGDPLRAWLAARSGVGAAHSIASVAVDRTLELGSNVPFSLVFVVVLLQQGIPQLERALVTVSIASLGLVLGIVIVVRRLRRGAGLVTALVASTRMDRLQFVGSHMELMQSSEASATRLIDQPPRMLGAFGTGLVANVLVLAEFALLLAAFDLPTTPVAVVAAIFATGAAHMLPIPAGIGVLEGAQMWLFEMLGYPADVGLAVGLACRFRELVWMLPGLLYLFWRWIGRTRQSAA